MRRPAAWSNADVIASLLASAVGMRSRLWIVMYYLTRSKKASRLLPRQVRCLVANIRLDGLAGPLHCDAGSGGLAVYYEIVTRSVYAPTPEWVPRLGQTVIDVGANVGVFSLWAANTIGRTGAVHAFEPNPLAFEMLTRNTAALTAINTRQVALGDQPTTMTLHYPPGRLSVGSFDPRSDRTESARVDVVRLDSALAEIVGDIDLVKVDVEGFEVPVLCGASETLRRTRRLVLEVAGTGLASCEALIAAAGLQKVGQFSGMWNISARHGVIAYFERPH